MQSTELVSVMIPYYNCKEYIAETIESVEQQTYPNIEIIIVNDGSTEEDTAYLQTYLSGKPQIKFAQQHNQGVAAARNHAARLATGKYFLFLDADDVILPEYIEKAVAILEANPECKLVYPQAELFGAQTKNWNLPNYKDFRTLLEGNHIPIIAVHYAQDFHAVSGFDERLMTHEDWDLWIRILEQGNKATQIPQILFRYRKRENKNSLIDQMTQNNFLMKTSWQHIYNKHSELFVKHGLGYHDLVYYRNKYEKYQNNWLRKFIRRLKKR